MTWTAMARVTDIEPGEVKGYCVANIPIALYNLGGAFFATHDVCTHAQACLSDGFLEDGRIECPLHQGSFDVRTGKAISGPVDTDLQTYPVRIEGGEIFVDLASP